MFYKGIAGIESMQMMTYEFNQERVVENLYRFMGTTEKEYLPHAVTVNEYFERLELEELQKVQQKRDAMGLAGISMEDNKEKLPVPSLFVIMSCSE